MHLKGIPTLLLILLIVSSCAKTEQEGQSPELAPYITLLKAEFLDITGVELNTNLPINIKPLSGTQRGLCRKQNGFNSTAREIFIDRETFDEHKDEEDYITTILLHEIGHCVYDLGHDDSLTELDTFNIPSTVMYRSTVQVIPRMKELKEFYYVEFLERAIK